VVRAAVLAEGRSSAEDRVTHDELVAYCLAKPGAVEDEPWEGDVVAKVGGKIFAFLGGGGLGVKCGATADEAAELRHRYPEHVTVMPYIGRHGWNSVLVDGTIPDEELRELVDESYDAIVAKLPKRLRP
jgi:predicted DNA-binding protein (MmcQ/YjbR family)